MFLHTFRLLFLRTRLLATVALLLAAANLLLPLLLSSSTPDTDPLALFLTYSSGLTRFLLTLFALWASCAALPQEAELHTLPLLLTRPVSRLRIWLGKWLAVVAACALLLLIAALAASFSAVRVARRAPAPSPLLPYAYAPVAPIPPDTSDAETALLARHRAAHGLPPDAPLPPRVLKNAHALAQSDAFTLPPDAALTLRFPPLPAPLPAAPHLLLAYRCDPAAPGAYPFRAHFDLADSAALSAPPLITLSADAPSGRPYALPMPLPDAPLPGSPLDLTIRQLPPPAAADSDADAPIAFYFDPDDGLALRVPVSTFAANVAKYLLATVVRLALLAAIGTTLGTLFSLPVAAFLSLALITLLQCSATLNEAAAADKSTFLSTLAETPSRAPAEEPPDAPTAPGHDHSHTSASLPRPIALAIYAAYRTTSLLLRPFLSDDTPALFLSATHIPPPALLRTLLTDLLAIPALLAILSALVLRRREWEVPA